MEQKIPSTRFRRRQNKLHIRRLDLFRYRDFRCVISAQGISQVADSMTTLGLAQVLLFDLSESDTGSAFLQALLLAAFPLVFAGPLAGYLSDKVSRQRLLGTGHLVRASITLLALVAAGYSLPPVGYLAFGSLLLTSRVLYTARAVSIPQLVNESELVAADSTSLIVSMFAGMGGAVFASALNLVNVNLIFVFAAVFHLVSSRLYWRVSTNLGGGNAVAQLKDWGLAKKFMANQKIRLAITSSGFGKLFVGMSFASVALMVDAKFNLEATGYAAVLGISGIGTFLGNLSAEWLIERFKRRAVAVMSASISALILVFAVSISHFLSAIAAIAVISFCFQNVRICNDAAVQANASAETLGRVFAAYDVVYNLSFVAGAILGLTLTREFGFWNMLVLCAASYAALAFGLLFAPDREPAPRIWIEIPASRHPAAGRTFRVSRTTGLAIKEATAIGSTFANSDQSVRTTSAEAPTHASSAVPA